MYRYDYPVKTRKVTDETGDSSLVVYYLTAQKNRVNRSEILYGIRVVQLVRGILSREEVTPPISQSCEQVKQLLDILILHQVIPMRVLRTIEELL
jgi:hypothetical protein